MLAPGTVVISAVGHCADIRKTVEPVLHLDAGSIYYIDLSNDKLKLGGSAFAQTRGKLGQDDINLTQISSGDLVHLLFAENNGLVIQAGNDAGFETLMNESGVKAIKIGTTVGGESLNVDTEYGKHVFDIQELRDAWYETSYLLDDKQTANGLARERYDNYKDQPLKYSFPPGFEGSPVNINTGAKPLAAIIREKGSNSEREMANALYQTGWDVRDVHMTDLIAGRENLEDIQFLGAVGGFSNSDVLGSAKGWAGSFKYNDKAKTALDKFFNRDETLSIGICNGCQLFLELDLINPDHSELAKMTYNDSKKHESSFTSVNIQKNNSVMLDRLEGTTLGVWISHGEGKFRLPLSEEHYNIVAKYAYGGYPSNPNGSDYNASLFEIHLLGIDRAGLWHFFGDSIKFENEGNPVTIKLPADGKKVMLSNMSAGVSIMGEDGTTYGSVEVIFPVLHGLHGEDGAIQGFAKLLGLACVGCSILGSAACMDKDVTKRLLRDARLGVAPFVTLRNGSADEYSYSDVVAELGKELFIKPVNLGSSVGVSFVDNEADYKIALENAFNYDAKVIVESKVDGKEIECAVLGNENPKASVIGEVAPTSAFYTFESKYVDKDDASLYIPADISEKDAERARALAVKAFVICECSGFSRVDMFLTADGQLIVNEINTIPGFTSISMYPKLWEYSGLPYKDLITKLIRLAQSQLDMQSGLLK